MIDIESKANVHQQVGDIFAKLAGDMREFAELGPPSTENARQYYALCEDAAPHYQELARLHYRFAAVRLAWEEQDDQPGE